MTDRFPLMDAAGERLLRHLEEHAHAPRYTHPGVDRLTPEGLRRAREFAEELKVSPPAWRAGEVPPWVPAFVEQCYRDVPFYRSGGLAPERFADIPPTTRADLNREPWAFVPDPQPLGDLIVYNTSGTTGHPLDIVTHPDVLGLYLPLLRAALGLYGVALEGGPGRVAVLLVCLQRRTYTYACVSAVLDQAGFIKVNLNRDDWRDSADRERFLDDCRPEVYSGDPVAFAELAKLPLRHRPKALVSTAMALAPGLKASLEERFGCPVLDIYSMNESGPIAVAEPEGRGYQLLQPRLYVEVLDAEGEACPPGVRGEVTLTGGFNPFLPLLRYRTGDYAALEFRGAQPLLIGLEGRPPVLFRTTDGRLINNVDLSIALRPLPIAQYAVHQEATGLLRVRVHGAGVPLDRIREALLDLFGSAQALLVEEGDALDVPGGKLVQYTSDLHGEGVEGERAVTEDNSCLPPHGA